MIGVADIAFHFEIFLLAFSMDPIAHLHFSSGGAGYFRQHFHVVFLFFPFVFRGFSATGNHGPHSWIPPPTTGIRILFESFPASRDVLIDHRGEAALGPVHATPLRLQLRSIKTMNILRC